jgi:hypothetical protein
VSKFRVRLIPDERTRIALASVIDIEADTVVIDEGFVCFLDDDEDIVRAFNGDIVKEVERL